MRVSKPNKKGQMELLGIALVVVMLVFVFLFFFTKSLAKPKKVQEQFAQAQLPKSLLNAITNTKTRCNALDMITVLDDCATAERLDCGGMPSCELIRNDIADDGGVLDTIIINNHLAAGYRWRVIGGSPSSGAVPIKQLYAEKNCATESPKEAAYQPIPLRGATVTMVLEVCPFT